MDHSLARSLNASLRGGAGSLRPSEFGDNDSIASSASVHMSGTAMAAAAAAASFKPAGGSASVGGGSTTSNASLSSMPPGFDNSKAKAASASTSSGGGGGGGGGRSFEEEAKIIAQLQKKQMDQAHAMAKKFPKYAKQIYEQQAQAFSKGLGGKEKGSTSSSAGGQLQQQSQQGTGQRFGQQQQHFGRQQFAAQQYYNPPLPPQPYPGTGQVFQPAGMFANLGPSSGFTAQQAGMSQLSSLAQRQQQQQQHQRRLQQQQQSAGYSGLGYPGGFGYGGR